MSFWNRKPHEHRFEFDWGSAVYHPLGVVLGGLERCNCGEERRESWSSPEYIAALDKEYERRHPSMGVLF